MEISQGLIFDNTTCVECSGTLGSYPAEIFTGCDACRRYFHILCINPILEPDHITCGNGGVKFFANQAQLQNAHNDSLYAKKINSYPSLTGNCWFCSVASIKGMTVEELLESYWLMDFVEPLLADNGARSHYSTEPAPILQQLLKAVGLSAAPLVYAPISGRNQWPEVKALITKNAGRRFLVALGGADQAHAAIAISPDGQSVVWEDPQAPHRSMGSWPTTVEVYHVYGPY